MLVKGALDNWYMFVGQILGLCFQTIFGVYVWHSKEEFSLDVKLLLSSLYIAHMLPLLFLSYVSLWNSLFILSTGYYHIPLTLSLLFLFVVYQIQRSVYLKWLHTQRVSISMVTSSNGNIFRALLAICAGNSPVICEFPAQRPVTRSFDVFFDLRLNNQLSKQWWRWWFETPLRPLWRPCMIT